MRLTFEQTLSSNCKYVERLQPLSITAQMDYPSPGGTSSSPLHSRICSSLGSPCTRQLASREPWPLFAELQSSIDAPDGSVLDVLGAGDQRPPAGFRPSSTSVLLRNIAKDVLRLSPAIQASGRASALASSASDTGPEGLTLPRRIHHEL
jgi:hypothetical protein